MTREQLVSEIEAVKAFSGTWIGNWVYQRGNVRMYRICEELFLQYISDKIQISKAELKLFDALYPGFATAILNESLNRDTLKERYLAMINSCRRRMSKINDNEFYSYDATTGVTKYLEIIARGFNGNNEISEDDALDNVLSTNYSLFKWWLFRTVVKYGPIPNSQSAKSVFYVDSTEWERVKEKFPKMVKRLIKGTIDICTNTGYFSDKEKVEELEGRIARLESDENDAVYIWCYNNYIKCISE